MDNIIGQLESSIQAKVDGDTDFQETIAALSEEERTQKIAERKSEEFNKEVSSLKEGSEKAIKAQELAENYKIRAEKAERQLKENPPKEGLSQLLSPKDYLALTEAGVSSDDFDEVERVSKILGKPIMDTLKDKTMKSILSERIEERKSALASQIRGGQRGPNQMTGEALLERASKGEMPEKQEDIDKLVKANLGIK